MDSAAAEDLDGEEARMSEYRSVTDIARVLQQVGALPGADT